MRLESYILNELFDSKVPIKFDYFSPFRNGGGEYVYGFTINNKNYDFTANYYLEDWDDEKDEQMVLEIEFSRAEYSYTNIDPYGVTGEGDALKVFSAVKSCMIDLMKMMKKNKHIPDIITFTSSEGSREKLYDRFMKLLPRLLKDYKFDKKEQYTGHEKKYLFKRGRK